MAVSACVCLSRVPPFGCSCCKHGVQTHALLGLSIFDQFGISGASTGWVGLQTGLDPTWSPAAMSA
eukprot:9959799-Alexandrium_andersonii.AAC.1